MAVLYTIRNWTERFEVSQSRKVSGPHSWVAMPCKHDGLGFRRIMALDDGMTVYGAWNLIVQIAAKCPTRGVLADENGPLDASDMAIKTGGRKEHFERALSVCSSNKIAWILVDRWEQAETDLPPQDSTEQDSTEQDKTGGAASPSSEALVPADLSPQFLDPPASPAPEEPPTPADPAPRAEDIPLPPELDSEDFRAALRDWFTQRRRRRKSVRPDHIARQYERLRPLGSINAAACLRYSVDNDYDGIFPERFNGRSSKIRPGSRASSDRERGL